jgi:hypothetical protein
MSATGMREIGYKQGGEFFGVLEKAGFTSDIVQQVINSRGNKMAKAMYATLVSDKGIVSSESEKFALLADLGTITVPDGYVHGKRLDSFSKENRGKFYGYNDAITDANFSNPSRVLKPGDKLHVYAFKQIASGSTTSQERMTFLRQQPGNQFVGAHGGSLVWEQKRDQLPKGYWYASFDEEDRLWEDASDGYHRVPCVHASSEGVFYFRLGHLGSVWGDGSALLGFCDE